MSLVIEGLVRRPIALEFDDLASLLDQVADVSTVVAGRRGTAVPLLGVLAVAGLESGAAWLTLESDDASFAASVPLEHMDGAVIVYALDGKPLPREMGGPLRLLIPDAIRCSGDKVDKCSNVKAIGLLRVESGHGHDTRPGTEEEHAALHEKPGHGHSR